MFSEDPAVADRIRRVAQSQAANANLQPADQADLEQELWCAVLAAEPAFDPGRGSAAGFAHVVATSKAANLARNAGAAKRSPGKRISLSFRLKDRTGHEIELADTIDSGAHARHIGRNYRDENDAACMHQDIAGFLKDLPPHLRELSGYLAEGNVSEAARKMGKPRTTVLYHVQQLQQLARAVGLDGYVE